MNNLPSNEVIAEESSNSTMDYMKDVDSDGGEISSILHLFTKDDNAPLMIVKLPEFADDQSDKMMKHMLLVPFISLLPVSAVSVCQDTWFSQKPTDKDNSSKEMWDKMSNGKFVRPSQDINRKQGLITMVVRDDMSGVFNMREYGRDDNGLLFTKDVVTTSIKDWTDDDTEIQSWLAPMMITGFKNKMKDVLDEKEDFDEEDLLKSLFSGFEVLHDAGFQYIVRGDMKKQIADYYSDISETDTYTMCMEAMDLMQGEDEDE